jgi:putative Ca2+/H+ antiporter (TMEM165/GDT1 family)
VGQILFALQRSGPDLPDRFGRVTLDLAALFLTFGAIFLVELPDKTFIATLVLSTRYRPVLVWLGVGAAFTVQTAVAVVLGRAASFLPDVVVQVAAAVLFLVGAVLLFREARQHQRGEEDDDGEEFAAKAAPAHGFRAVVASFLVLFAAEWGDLSQLLTISLVARYDAPLSVFIGALAALLTVSALAVVAGRTLMRFVPLHVLFYVGAGVCLVLEALLIREIAF